MKTMQTLKSALLTLVLLFTGVFAKAQVTYTDQFATPVNYLTNGVKGTNFWSGVYFGNGQRWTNVGVQTNLLGGDFNYAAIAGGSPGQTFFAQTGFSNITVTNIWGGGTVTNTNTYNMLTVQDGGNAWGDGANDNGFFLFKQIRAGQDFSVQVYLPGPPRDNGANHTTGLMIRNTGLNGNPATGGENFMTYSHFYNLFNIGQYLRNIVNGANNQQPLGADTTNFWLRVECIGGTNFTFFNGPDGTNWIQTHTSTRADFATATTLQVGLADCTFVTQNTPRIANYSEFTLVESNSTLSTMPSPPTSLVVSTNASNHTEISWVNDASADGAIVVAWTQSNFVFNIDPLLNVATNNLVRQTPANGIQYTPNNVIGTATNQLATLPALNHQVVFLGSGTNVTMSNTLPGLTYQIAVYAYKGAGTNITYNHTPVQAAIVGNAAPTGLTVTGLTPPLVSTSKRNMKVMLNFNNGTSTDVTTLAGTAYVSTNPAVADNTPGQKGRFNILTPGSFSMEVTNITTLGGTSYTNSFSTGTLTTVASNAVGMTHRWSFNGEAFDSTNTNVPDSIGGANGSISNIVNGGFPTWLGDGTIFYGPGNTTFVQLPPDLFTNYGLMTIEIFYTDAGGAAGARLIDAGSANGARVGLSLAVSGVTAPGSTVTTPTRPTSNSPHVAAFTVGGISSNHVIYVDGLKLATTTGTTATPESIGAQPTIRFGQGFNGTQYEGNIDELRIYNQEIDNLTAALNAALGPNNTNIAGVGSPTALTATTAQTNLTVDDTVGVTVLATYSGLGAPVNVTTILPNTTFATSNAAVVTVSAAGIVTAVGTGSTIVTATYTTATTTNTASLAFAVVAYDKILGHRYSFNGDLTDSIAAANGSATGNVTFSPDGQKVVLTPNPTALAKSAYVSLPANLLTNYSSITIGIWYTELAPRIWSRIFDAGNFPDTTRNWWIALNGANAGIRATAAFNAAATEQQVNSAGVPLGGQHHFAYAFDGPTGFGDMYLDGVRRAKLQTGSNNVAGGNAPINRRPRDIGPTSAVFVGAAQFGDADWAATIDELRIYTYAANQLHVLAEIGAGPDAPTAFLTNLVNSSTNRGALTSVSIAQVQSNSLISAVSNMVVGGQQRGAALANFANLSNVWVYGSDLITNVFTNFFASNWTSSDSTVLKVATNGVITAVGAGSATVSATYAGVTGVSSSITVGAATAADLAHRFSFTGASLADTGTMAGSPGTNGGGATFAGDALVLSGATNQFVRLPAGLLSNLNDVTFEAWAAFALPVTGTNQGTARLFDFGSPGNISDPTLGTNNWFGFSPSATSAGSNASFRYNLALDGLNAQRSLLSGANPTMATNVTNHYAWVISSNLNRASYYVNGKLADVYPFTNLWPSPLVGLVTNVESYLGRIVQFGQAGPTTSNMTGSIDEFRIWNGVLDSVEVQKSFTAGPSAASPLAGAVSSISMTLVDSNAIIGGWQLPLVTGNNGNTLDLTRNALVILSSANPAIAAIFRDGDLGADKVLAVSAGSTTITATYAGVSTTNSITVVAKTPQIVHRWGFRSNTVDTFNPGVSGTLFGMATVTNYALSLERLRVPASYMQLPNDLISGYDAITIELWAKPGNNPVANRLIDLGDKVYGDGLQNGGGFVNVKSSSGNNTAPQAAIQGRGLGQEVQNGAVVGNNVNSNIHYVATVNNVGGATVMNFYTNGVFVSTDNTTNVILSRVNNDFSYVGRSLAQGDGAYGGSIDELRIWYGALDAAGVANSYSLGADHAKLFITNVSPTQVTVAWTNTLLTVPFVLQTNSDLTTTNWADVGTSPSVVGGYKVITNTTSTALFYRLKQN